MNHSLLLEKMPNHYEPIFNVQTPKVLQKPEVHVLCVCNEIYNNDTKVEPVHKFSVDLCSPEDKAYCHLTNPEIVANRKWTLLTVIQRLGWRQLKPAGFYLLNCAKSDSILNKIKTCHFAGLVPDS
jgi:hypothetical protein